jgi:lysophospholipase L1-like esterase
MTKYLYLLLLILVTGACKKGNVRPAAENAPKAFTSIVILGNSITYSERNASIGWNDSWGMAASSREKDYVHLLSSKFRQTDSSARVRALNIAAFELDYAHYDFDKELRAYRTLRPDLLILRIGENVQQGGFDAMSFQQRYSNLISYFKSGNPNLTVLSVGSFWPDRRYVNAEMQKHQPYLSLEPLGFDITNYAFDRPNVDQSVKGHPGDKGMQGIADMIWQSLQQIN